VVEVAYSQSQADVLTKVKEYWLKNHSRVHDVIVVKIDQVPEDETPKRVAFLRFGQN
jgi:predicted secreted protein